MTISAKLIADSSTSDGVRLTSWVLRYHRYIHAELMTHRVFSRNASSSRAIPVEKMIAWCQEDPAIPIEWGKNQKGMQAGEPLNAGEQIIAEKAWLQARDRAIEATRLLLELGVHKQIANRILEPWHHIAVIVSTTQLKNWFALRNHKDAMPEIKHLAALMQTEYNASTPVRRENSWLSLPEDIKGAPAWHLPFITDQERWHYPVDVLIKCSVARCARVSYMNHDGTSPSIEKDLELHDRLVVQQPLHASPAEHQARPLIQGESPERLSGNFARGWLQYRKTLRNECVGET